MGAELRGAQQYFELARHTRAAVYLAEICGLLTKINRVDPKLAKLVSFEARKRAVRKVLLQITSPSQSHMNTTDEVCRLGGFLL